ncbi:hypothetical protein BDD12DRAFT_833403 [Trichophaea hybrida]|nr:hypothetical protein BDD12DRAFT_833403 [Trichophaea hybrida]
MHLSYQSHLSTYPVAFPARRLLSPPQLQMTTPRVYTYHCTFCSHLLLASTHIFTSLPTRRSPGLDNATIVPLPAPEPDDEDEDTVMANTGREIRGKGYTLMLTLLRDRQAKVVTREDGFEKRTLLRCGRCRLVVAYQLEAQGGFLYVLPGAVTESGELGKEEAAVELGMGMVMA